LSNSDLSPFYLLSGPLVDPRIADLNPDALYESQKIICPLFPKHRRARRLSPLDVILPCSHPPDVMFTWMSYCLIQEKVRDIFEEEGLTGFSTRPAKAKMNRTGVSVPAVELVVTGWGGMAPTASGIREDYRCDACGHLHYSSLQEPGALVDPRNWDGSDFFTIWPLPLFRFVSQRVIDVFRKHHITRATFDQHFPSTSADGYSPSRLSYYMTPARARAIGDDLDISS
jgi:hypothetical protein